MRGPISPDYNGVSTLKVTPTEVCEGFQGTLGSAQLDVDFTGAAHDGTCYRRAHCSIPPGEPDDVSSEGEGGGQGQ